MPKGVEHLDAVHNPIAGNYVTTAVMPKGVEHCRMPTRRSRWRLCDDSSDAERR